MDEIGRNITGIERLINARLGLTEKDDTLPDRWFEEEITAGPFVGEKIDRAAFEALKVRYYDLLGLNGAGVPALEWHRRLAEAITGFAVQVTLPEGIRSPGRGGHRRSARVRRRRTPGGIEEAASPRGPETGRRTLIVSVNGAMVLSNEDATPVRSGDEVTVMRIIAGG